jgi:hypothetical protein
LNEVKISKATIKDEGKNPRDFVFGIPPDLFKAVVVNILEFNIKNPVSPKSVRVGNDKKSLGFRFHSISFN